MVFGYMGAGASHGAAVSGALLSHWATGSPDAGDGPASTLPAGVPALPVLPDEERWTLTSALQTLYCHHGEKS